MTATDTNVNLTELIGIEPSLIERFAQMLERPNVPVYDGLVAHVAASTAPFISRSRARLDGPLNVSIAVNKSYRGENNPMTVSSVDLVVRGRYSYSETSATADVHIQYYSGLLDPYFSVSANRWIGTRYEQFPEGGRKDIAKQVRDFVAEYVTSLDILVALAHEAQLLNNHQDANATRSQMKHEFSRWMRALADPAELYVAPPEG